MEQFVASLGSLPFSATIIEIGMGNGSLTSELLSAYPMISRYIGIEPAEAMVAAISASLRSDSRFKAINERFEAWESGSWKADAVVTRYVLHDFPDHLENWYRRIANMLKTGGRFVNLDVTLCDDPTETWANLDSVIQLANSVQTDDWGEETAKKRFIQHLREEVHRYRPLNDHLQILSMVGLESEVLARDGNNYLLRAVKI